MLTWIQVQKGLLKCDPLCSCRDGGTWLWGTNHFPATRERRHRNSLFTTQQALHCHWVLLLNWMVHRLLNYFYIPAFHCRLKAYYWRDWDHRNLLHVWPFKAFHCDGSQVRIYWNHILCESLMLAHRHNPVKHSVCKRRRKSKKKKTSPTKQRKKQETGALTTGNWQHFKHI